MINKAILEASRDERGELENRILELVKLYAERYHVRPPFVAGTSPVPVSGRVYDADELVNLVDSALEFWLTTGRYNEEFEKRLSDYLKVRFALTCNSGSSANLLAATALTSHMLRDNALRPGDEVITCATGFPTTVNPLLQNGLVPVFVDVSVPTYNINAEQIEGAISERTRAIMVAHALGNPFDVATVLRIAKKFDLYVVEDTCDALGAKYDDKLVGTFGDIGTLSFYPAHHITMGEGGAVFTQNAKLARILESVRDWGRDCWCAPGKDNTCGKRFDRKLGSLPQGYDHKYTYSHLGYNLKITDMQAAVGCAQLSKLSSFISHRQRNFDLLHAKLKEVEDAIILPQATPRSVPSWFGFPITVRENSRLKRDELVRYLNEHRIGTRLLFGGNLVHQPYMKGRAYRVFGELKESDMVMTRTFWTGIFPGLDTAAIEYVADKIIKFVKASGKP